MTKKVYQVRNWREYNQTLVRRGSINFWFSEECIAKWCSQERTGHRGRPTKYSDEAIECGLTVKALLGLTFRATEGFIRGLFELMGLTLEVPDYTLLCKRQRTLQVKLPKRITPLSEKLDVVVDSTGLKVYGEGEWKVRQHEKSKRRVWRKLHLAINVATQEIESFELSDLGTQDWEGFEKLVSLIDKPLNTAIGDGAYDRLPCYELAERRNFNMITPPQRNAKTTQERGHKINKKKKALLKQRDKAIEGVRALGRKKWKESVGYHKRSLAETGMFRVKTILGDKLSTRKFENQKVEAAIWCKIINQMTQMGMPVSMG
jgi:Transposase DDE domain